MYKSMKMVLLISWSYEGPASERYKHSLNWCNFALYTRLVIKIIFEFLEEAERVIKKKKGWCDHEGTEVSKAK